MQLRVSCTLRSRPKHVQNRNQTRKEIELVPYNCCSGFQSEGPEGLTLRKACVRTEPTSSCFGKVSAKFWRIVGVIFFLSANVCLSARVTKRGSFCSTDRSIKFTALVKSAQVSLADQQTLELLHWEIRRKWQKRTCTSKATSRELTGMKHNGTL
jgi:hypothetical protein